MLMMVMMMIRKKASVKGRKGEKEKVIWKKTKMGHAKQNVRK
jgi:hypothetical protein